MNPDTVALADNTELVIAPYSVFPPGPNPANPMTRNGRIGLPFEVPNPHIYRGEADMETTPVIFNRYGVYWGTQLAAGFINIPRNWLRLSSVYRRAGWRNYIVPIEPGKVHGGVMAGGYPKRGPAPSQVQMAFNATAGAQPNYPGGPGQKVIGLPFSNPGTGALWKHSMANSLIQEMLKDIIQNYIKQHLNHCLKDGSSQTWVLLILLCRIHIGHLLVSRIILGTVRN